MISRKRRLRGKEFSMAVIEVKNLKKYFGKIQTVHAIDGIHFAVEKGELFNFYWTCTSSNSSRRNPV